MLENLRFEKITEGTDFEHSDIKSIVQDSNGFIWFATDYGLVRYDGINLKKFDPFSTNTIHPIDSGIVSMCISRSGKLIFVSKYHSHLIEFCIETESFSNITLPLKIKNITRVLEDEYCNVWIGTSWDGFYKFSDNYKNYSHYKRDETYSFIIKSNTIQGFYFDRYSNKLLIGTNRGGLNVYDYFKNSLSFLEYDRDHLNKEVIVKCIYRDNKNRLWVGQSNGLFVLNNECNLLKKYQFSENTSNTISGNWIESICEDDKGFIWIGTRSKGINCIDPENEIVVRFNLNIHNTIGKFNNRTHVLFKDRSNVIWIGAQSNGIGRVNADEKKFYSLSHESLSSELNSLDINAIYKDSENSLWLGTAYNGLYIHKAVNDNTYEMIGFKDLENVTITSISSDIKGNLWIGCNKYGLIYIHPDKNEINVVDQELFLKNKNLLHFIGSFIFRDIINPNHLWICVNFKEVYILDTENISFVSNDLLFKELHNATVYCMYFDSNQNLWIGTKDFGIYKYNYVINELVNYNFDPENEKSISDITIYAIAEDLDKNLWIGTASAGLNKFDRESNSFKRVDIPGNEVNAILTDDNNHLWISANRLLLKYDINRNEMHAYHDLNEFNFGAYFKSNDGIFYFGGRKGVTYFKPNEITTNLYIPTIVLTDFQIFYESVKPSPENPFLKKSISYADEINLTYKESVITFEFAALIFNNPKRNQYAYKMEGFDEDWVYCGSRRTATYTNLNPGEYTFKVKGSNNDGLWNEEGTSVKITITPPWYKTLLFKGVVGIGLVGGIGSFYRKRIQQLNKEKKQQEEFTKKLIESQENERKRVAAELHDSLGQDLLIIKNKALVSIKKNEPEKLLEQMNEISELTSTSLNDVREISYNLRPYELDRLGLTKTITSMIERANSSTNMTFTANVDDIDKIFIPEVEINIYRIIQESLNNVIKHSEAKYVIVNVSKREKYILINISDDGKGFDADKLYIDSVKKGFGLKGISERVKLLDGSFAIKSGPGKGTEILILISYK